MEYATGALGTLLPKLGQLLRDEYRLQKGAKKNIEDLTKELECIQAALRDVGEVPLDERSELLRIWARDAREMSYDMEDMVDTFLVRVQGPDERPSKRKVKRFFKKLWDDVTKAKIRRDIGQEINDIKERVKEVAERRARYKFDDITPAKTFSVDPRIAFLNTKATDLIGIDKAREEVITKLTKGDNNVLSAQQRIISIVGFGGLGKTTLAKAVYDKLKGPFDCTAFVSVGRNPDNIKNIFRNILIQLDKGRYEKFNFSIFDDEMQLINELRDFLGNKRYFIVIDDIWDTKAWKIIQLALVDNNSGSIIIITTRKYEVAQQAGGIYRLEPLSDDNSRKLFFARMYDGESKASNHQPDDEVSDKILKKCGDIPLAIITMASLLEGKHMEEWSEILNSIDFGSKENQQVEDTMKIISFSYYDLPPHLRICLLYLSVFPEDYFIEKDALIWMWIAEDFIVHKKQGIMSSFEIGERWFSELVNRSMIQLVEKWDEGSRILVHGCQVHDMVLDLICSISSEENFVTILDNKEGASSSSSSSPGKVYRLALHNNRIVESHMVGMGRVRSFISCDCDIDKGIPLSSFTLIRVLAIYNGVFGRKHRHLKHIQNLLHLRYLQLSGGEAELPEEIGNLKFLETLHVYRLLNAKVVSLLTQLRCLRLDLGNSVSATIFTDGIKLTSLEELEVCFGYHAFKSQEPWRRFVKELGSLKELKVLRLGSCNAFSMEVQIDLVESLRSLGKMEHLSLHAYWSSSADTATWEAAGFRLPRHIRYLLLNGINFSGFPSFCINRLCLPNLSHLSLSVDAIEEQELQILGQLPELRFLDLKVESTAEIMVCSAATTDPAGDGGRFFKKLRHCTLNPWEVLLLPSKDGVSFRMRRVHATVLLGSEWNGVSSGKGLAAALMPRVHKLSFKVFSVREFKDENHGDGLCLEYFASLQNINVKIYIDDASDAEVEVKEVEASLQRAARVHPNHPLVETVRYNAPMFPEWKAWAASRQAHEAEVEQQQDDEAGSSARD
ncbi:disease resistance protein PIK6-NP-like isoform X3 [Panicum virgatum]|uniref:disease resistance protein PIK6-NP-like isoform X3 n=1 Tax=Panicum virgatum TaxID=38727 RepID=UPI0019D5677B|nr:disease resistance protein PIK6-NP-like isoform X3 [Panicum virgatum]